MASTHYMTKAQKILILNPTIQTVLFIFLHPWFAFKAHSSAAHFHVMDYPEKHPSLSHREKNGNNVWKMKKRTRQTYYFLPKKISFLQGCAVLNVAWKWWWVGECIKYGLQWWCLWCNRRFLQDIAFACFNFFPTSSSSPYFIWRCVMHKMCWICIK